MLENGGGMVYGARELAVLCSQVSAPGNLTHETAMTTCQTDKLTQ